VILGVNFGISQRRIVDLLDQLLTQKINFVSLLLVIETTTPSISMKPAPKSITFTPSKTISQQLEDFSRIARVSTEEFLNALLEKAITEEDSLFPDSPSPALRRFIFERRYSIEEAKRIADNYNAFAAEQAQAEGHSVRDEAKVNPRADEDGLFKIWFPVKRTAQGIKKRERRAKRRKSIMEPEEPEDPADWWKKEDPQ
jgi:hypothetical protein